MRAWLFSFSLLALVTTLAAALGAEAGIRLEGFKYPFPEATYALKSQGQSLEMVYMDVAPRGAPRGTVVLLHGKNFSGSYFGQTATALREAGYRVIMPDQVGFGKSTKPEHYHFTFHQLARNTRDLLASLGVARVHVLGHSMGGMVATRFALMFPEATASLILMNPLGLEDWQTLGVPYATVDDNFRQELAKTLEKIRAYQRESYYDGKWRPEYDPWVEQLASFNKSPQYPRAAWNQALTSDMVFTQPVVLEFGRISSPTLLIIGQRDRTAIGKEAAPPAVREKLGNYPALGRAAKAAIRGSELVEFEGVGHMPHIEAFDRFFPPLRAFLDRQAQAGTSKL
ncbi:MAG: alpha/beta hydrolase [Verrucomicrobiota bacterium]